jgi:glycosyltransferase involved in cell wall biosynthesis
MTNIEYFERAARKPIPASTRRSQGLGRALFLVSPSATPCGVEMFTRRVAETWPEIGFSENSVQVSGKITDLIRVWTALTDVDALVVSFPVVAWKKVLLTPLLALVLAHVRGKQTILFLHEWDDLDWRRRVVIFVYALLARHILFSSPMVLAQFKKGALARNIDVETSVVPIPSNIKPVTITGSSSLAKRVRAERDKGKLVIGHFGSIYPRKQADFVLEAAAELKRLGRDVFVTLVGGFVKGHDGVEEELYAKMRGLGLEGNVLVTGYIASEQEILALFEEVDCWVYRFAEGLSSRRGSVLACLQTGKLVVVNAPASDNEFAHHRTYSLALESGSLRLIEKDADAKRYAATLLAAPVAPSSKPIAMFEMGWRDAAHALAAAFASSGAWTLRTAAERTMLERRARSREPAHAEP